MCPAFSIYNVIDLYLFKIIYFFDANINLLLKLKCCIIKGVRTRKSFFLKKFS